MAFGLNGAASGMAAAQAAIPRLNLAVPRKSDGGGVGLASTAAGVRDPSVGHALAAWLFGGSTPMDDERARIAGAQQAQQMLQMRQALISKLTGGGSDPAGIPMRGAPEAAPAPSLTPPALPPLKVAADDVAANLGANSFGAAPAAMRGREGVSVDAPALPAGIPMKGGAAPAAQRGKIPTLRDSADWLLPMAAMGVPGAKEAIDYLDKTSPKGTNVNNRFLDERDPAAMGQYYGDAPSRGSEPVYDRNGKEVGWRMADGSLKVMEQSSEADQLGKTRGTLTDIPMRDGSTKKMLAGDFIDMQKGGDGTYAAIPPRGGSGAVGVGGLGQSQTPAEKKLAEGRADTQVGKEAAAPKAYSGLEAQARATDLVLEKLDSILGPEKHPEQGRVSGGLGGTVGLNALTSGIPNTASHDLDATLDTIRSIIGFDKLQEMRANSPTGGALGAISDKENKLLQSVFGSLDQAQSPEQFRANLDRARTELRAVKDQRAAAYGRQYTTPSASAPTRATQYTPEQARAELARRRGGR